MALEIVEGRTGISENGSLIGSNRCNRGDNIGGQLAQESTTKAVVVF